MIKKKFIMINNNYIIGKTNLFCKLINIKNKILLRITKEIRQL